MEMGIKIAKGYIPLGEMPLAAFASGSSEFDADLASE